MYAEDEIKKGSTLDEALKKLNKDYENDIPELYKEWLETNK